MDFAWWQQHIEEVRLNFLGARVSNNALPKNFDINHWPQREVGNSGAGAVRLAITGGATKVILLGYDCQHTDGKRHWHGNHPKGLGNACVVTKWPRHFEKVVSLYPGIEILNATRVTALNVFPRVSLESALEHS